MNHERILGILPSPIKKRKKAYDKKIEMYEFYIYLSITKYYGSDWTHCIHAKVLCVVEGSKIIINKLIYLMNDLCAVIIIITMKRRIKTGLVPK